MINATNDSKPRELTPAGSHLARCYSMILLGTAEEEYMGDKKLQTKVLIGFELPEELRKYKEGETEKPMTISVEYTLSMAEKSNLRKVLESWRGKGFTDEEAKKFDITKLLSIPCLLNIIHTVSKKGKPYAKIVGISPIPKSMKCPDQINKSFEFNFEDKFNDEILEKFPSFIKDRIKASDEYKALIQPENTSGIEHEETDANSENDPLPF